MANARDPKVDAVFMFNLHGNEAVIHAAMHADEHMAEGDMEAAYYWRRVIAVLHEIMEPPTQAVH